MIKIWLTHNNSKSLSKLPLCLSQSSEKLSNPFSDLYQKYKSLNSSGCIYWSLKVESIKSDHLSKQDSFQTGLLGSIPQTKNINICGLTIQPKIKWVLVLIYAVSEPGLFKKKQLIQVNSIFKTNIFEFISGHLLFVVHQKSVGGALSISDYNYDSLCHNLHMERLF